jgi:hypothetical protein
MRKLTPTFNFIQKKMKMETRNHEVRWIITVWPKIFSYYTLSLSLSPPLNHNFFFHQHDHGPPFESSSLPNAHTNTNHHWTATT